MIKLYSINNCGLVPHAKPITVCILRLCCTDDAWAYLELKKIPNLRLRVSIDTVFVLTALEHPTAAPCTSELIL